MRHIMQHPGDDAPADDQHEGDEGCELDEGQPQHAPEAETEAQCQKIMGGGIAGAENAGQCGQQHERDDHGEIFDDQPADSDATAFGLHQMAFLHGAQQHHGTCDRQRQAEDECRAERPIHPPGERRAHRRCNADLEDRAWHSDRAHRQQIFEREMQPHPEHEQDHAKFGKFRRQALIGNEARRVRPGEDAGHKITNERWQAQPIGDRAEDEGEAKTNDDRGNEGRLMRHVGDYSTGVPLSPASKNSNIYMRASDDRQNKAAPNFG